MISAVLCVFVGFGPLSWEEGLTDFSETPACRKELLDWGAPGMKAMFCFLHGLWLSTSFCPRGFNRHRAHPGEQGKVTGVSLRVYKVWGFVLFDFEKERGFACSSNSICRPG